MGKRIGLFLLTNVLVMITISIVIHLLGLGFYLNQHGLDYRALAAFCLVWGMGGSFISLLMSKWMAKTMMGVQVISVDTPDSSAQALLSLVHRLARDAGLTSMPEVGVYEAAEPNAFATGPSKHNSLVAVSSGLLSQMNTDEVEGVLGHEISHVANGDMVTMTLIQGVVNAFAMFLSRIVAYAISMAINRGENDRQEGSGFLFYILTFVFDILFTLLGSFVVAAFSRYREYRADAGGANLAGKSKMIAALQKLKQMVDAPEDDRAPALAALKISHKGSWLSLLATHPPLEERIARLQSQE